MRFSFMSETDNSYRNSFSDFMDGIKNALNSRIQGEFGIENYKKVDIY